MKDYTELVFVLDRSGSMAGLEEDTIGGFNGMLEKQKKEGVNALVSTVLFDTVNEVIHDRIPVYEVVELTEKEYYVRGATALLDALGSAINHIGNIHKYAREEDRPKATLFVIITDGQENSSSKFTYKAVKKLVERQKEKYGWEFIFIGANMDAVKEASKYGIGSERAINYRSDKEGTRVSYDALGDAVREYCDEIQIPCFLKKRIEDDCERRGK